MNNQTNYTMLCDFYELSMANGYFQTPLKDCITYFDVFFRTIPDEGGFAITAGLEQVVNYIQNLTFTDEDIEYLRSKGGFVEEFLDYLKNFKFTGDIWAIPEGTTAASHAIVVEGDGQATFGNTAQALVEPGTDLRIFAKPEVHGHRRMAVALAIGADESDARARAAHVADSLDIRVI